MAAKPGGMRAFPLEARGSAENSRLERADEGIGKIKHFFCDAGLVHYLSGENKERDRQQRIGIHSRSAQRQERLLFCNKRRLYK